MGAGDGLDRIAGSEPGAAVGGWDPAAYPPALRDAERRLLRAAAEATGRGPLVVGVALSGGGIRSATFCLGVFQALARLHLLGHVAYLSTVSGGGYFGAFLGRLFTREPIAGVRDVERVLAGGRPSRDGHGIGGPPAEDGPLRWLRENGRYLSPRGHGDLLLGGAVLLRNWVAVHVVLATLVLAAFLTVELLRGTAEVALGRSLWEIGPLAQAVLPSGRSVWWSPVTLLALGFFLLGAVPFGWAYWLVVSRFEARGPGWALHPVWGVLVAVAALVLLAVGSTGGPRVWRIAAASAVAGGLTLVWWRLARARAWRAAEREAFEADSKARRLFETAQARNWLSARLKDALLLTGVATAMALIDSLGQTVYLLVRTGQLGGAWSAGMFMGLIGFAAFARQLVVYFGGRPGGMRPRLPVTILATIGALLIAGVALTSLNALSHGLAWGFGPLPAAACVVCEAATWRYGTWASLYPAVGTWAILLTLSWLFGRSRTFLNNSSHQALYSARLTRAYLGASNGRRVDAGGTPVTQVIRGDDLPVERYWPRLAPERDLLYRKGLPIHLINVTINETVDGRSQVQQQDRKGTGMALGPAGISVGVRHHAVFESDGDGTPGTVSVRVYPDAPTGQPPPYRVFEYRDGRFAGEMLSLGQWVGISGAAFSTGLGARTSLGLSLLTGFGNVRLGYWWDSGVTPSTRVGRDGKTWTRRRRGLLHWLFPVQGFLLDEFLARFHGTAGPEWYLSDGGHFENLGGYELIRRRLPVIVLVDAEADPAYTFEGLANLVRKARLDFGAEIRFLTEPELQRTVDRRVKESFGPLEALRREGSLDTVATGPLSRAHAALAHVYYDGAAAPGSWLLYIKPTLTGDEPVDVLQYHTTHPAFPQEPTADQFFDEAQWESYRRLGDHIAERVFIRVDRGEAAQFAPSLLSGLGKPEQPQAEVEREGRRS